MGKTQLLQTPKSLQFVKFEKTNTYGNFETDVFIKEGKKSKKIMRISNFGYITVALNMDFDYIHEEMQEEIKQLVLEYVQNIHHQKIVFDDVANYKHEIYTIIQNLDVKPCVEDVNWVMKKLSLKFPLFVQKEITTDVKIVTETLKFIDTFTVNGLKRVQKTNRKNINFSYFSSNSDGYFCDEFCAVMEKIKSYAIITEEEFNQVYDKDYDKVTIGVECLLWKSVYQDAKSEQNQLNHLEY